MLLEDDGDGLWHLWLINHSCSHVTEKLPNFGWWPQNSLSCGFYYYCLFPFTQKIFLILFHVCKVLFFLLKVQISWVFPLLSFCLFFPSQDFISVSYSFTHSFSISSKMLFLLLGNILPSLLYVLVAIAFCLGADTVSTRGKNAFHSLVICSVSEVDWAHSRG